MKIICSISSNQKATADGLDLSWNDFEILAYRNKRIHRSVHIL